MPVKAKTKELQPLTVKQRKFVKAYVDSDGNGVHAALKAYDVENPSTAGSIASQNLDKPNVRAEIEKALAELNITKSYILGGFKRLADHDDNGMVKNRALENLADISEMYPNKGTNLELGDGKLKISWE
jgi:phage terminase small subunit